MALAKELCTTGFLPVAIKTPAQAVAVILTGKELGLPPMQSLRSICIIQGKPELSADLQLSIFHRDGGRSKWVALTNTEAKLWLKHPCGDEHTESFTIQDAQKAGLANGQNWVKYPKAMLRSRAITAGMKSIGFEPLTGAYGQGEIGGPEPVLTADPVAVVVTSEPDDAEPVEEGDVAPPSAKRTRKPLEMATAGTRAAALDRLGCQEDGVPKNHLHSYLVALGWLDNEKCVENWPIRFVPISKVELEAIATGLAEYSQSGNAVRPYAPHGLDPETLQAHPVAPPAAAPAPEPEWTRFVMPFGRLKGKTLGQFTLDEMEFYQQFKVEEQPKSPESEAMQIALRAALDEAKATKKG